MKNKTWKIVITIFNLWCVVITAGLAGFWIYKFALNEDLSAVYYKEYYDYKDDTYPSMSMCFRNPFRSFKIDHGEQFNHSNLENYLSGKGSMEMANIVYEDITLQLDDYLINYWIRWRNGSESLYLPSTYEWHPVSVSYSGFWREMFFKCFDLESPSKYVEIISLKIDNMVFPHGSRPNFQGFFIMFHYPNQILRPSLFSKYIWGTQKFQNDSGYGMRFSVENVEIYKRRRDCVKNWLGYDTEVMEFYMHNAGCRPPYYTEKHNLPLCNTSKQMQEIGSSLSLGMHYDVPPPCKAMENINFKYEELDYSGTKWESYGHFWCELIMPNILFKVIISYIFF